MRSASPWHDRAVVLSRKLLNDGEHVILSTRTHVKALLLPAVVLILVAGVAGYLSSLPNGSHAGTWRLVIWALAAVLIICAVLYRKFKHTGWL